MVKMPNQKLTFDGKINGKNVKTIVSQKYHEKSVFAKPKNQDVETPHFSEKNDKLSFHEDSADDKKYRVMSDQTIGSEFYTSGSYFIPNQGKDIAVLPIECTNYNINSSLSGLSISLDNACWVLKARGYRSNWEFKKN